MNISNCLLNNTDLQVKGLLGYLYCMLVGTNIMDSSCIRVILVVTMVDGKLHV
jgi:hypothetical protein